MVIDTARAAALSLDTGAFGAAPQRSEAPTTVGTPDLDTSTLVWEGEMDGLALATLLALSMRHAMVPCEIEGRPHRARAQGCWFDAGRGLLVVELVGRPEPMA